MDPSPLIANSPEISSGFWWPVGTLKKGADWGLEGRRSSRWQEIEYATMLETVYVCIYVFIHNYSLSASHSICILLHIMHLNTHIYIIIYIYIYRITWQDYPFQTVKLMDYPMVIEVKTCLVAIWTRFPRFPGHTRSQESWWNDVTCIFFMIQPFMSHRRSSQPSPCRFVTPFSWEPRPKHPCRMPVAAKGEVREQNYGPIFPTMGVSYNGGTPIAGWFIYIYIMFIMENPMKMDDLGIHPNLGNLHVVSLN